MNWKREINQLAGTDEEETPLLFRAFVFRKLNTQKHNSRVQKFPPLKIHRKQAFRNWQTPENKPTATAGTIAKRTKDFLRDKSPRERRRSENAQPLCKQSSVVENRCNKILSEHSHGPQIPIPGPTSTPLSEALVSSVRVSLLVRCVVSFGKHSSSCAPRRGKTRRYRYGDELEAASGAIFETSSECGCSAHNNPWGSVLFFSFCPQRLCQ